MSIIEVKHLTKEYDLGTITSIKDTLRHMLAKIQGKDTWQRERFKALDDVSFTIEEGEVVGIIGHNGAGKSTLLKHLANITKPTSGEVIVRGSIAPLIEVGAGVNPELTGRENIFLNGAILGISKKVIQSKLDEIIDFSELEQFIDTPVKRYSSGMTVKLGFSIATSMDADILIIDEVLAVGDLAFQRKCFERMESLIKKQNKTVLIVSHNIRQIERMCSRALLFNNGKISADDTAKSTCDIFYQQSNEKIFNQSHDSSLSSAPQQSMGIITSINIEILDDCGNPTTEILSRDALHVRIDFTLSSPLHNPNFFIGTHRSDFLYLTVSNIKDFTSSTTFPSGPNSIDYKIKHFPLTSGSYCIRLVIMDANETLLFAGESLKIFNVKTEKAEPANNKWKTLNLDTQLRINGVVFENELNEQAKIPSSD